MSERPAPGSELVLTAPQLAALLGPEAAVWPDLGLTATHAPGRVRVWWDQDLIGYTQQSTEFPDLAVFHAIVTTDPVMDVPMPAGFIPSDPLWFQDSERRRWLPDGHPDKPTIDPPYPGPGITGPRDTVFWAGRREQQESQR